jgi:leader peptidase (prepilin peptidase)/N-methyltransferase
MEELLDIVPAWQFILFAALFGAAWGSFANVVIVRWPLGLSVVRPPSHCFSCDRPIASYDNIPIISYILLGGKCRYCKTQFSPRYAVVELAMALLSVAVMRMTLLNDPPSFQFGLTEYFIWFSFIWALVTAGMIDLETFLLPDVISFPGIVIGVLVNGFVLNRGFIDPIVGAAGSYIVIYGVFVYGYKKLTGKQGMGEGDPKFLAMIGAFFGVEGAVFALFAGAVQGLIVGSVLVVYRRRTGVAPEAPLLDDELDEDGQELDEDPRFRKARVPFGPFLALGAIEYYFVGAIVLELYLNGVAGIMNRLLGVS